MKVLHTNFLRGWGGQSNRILMECCELAERGWEVLLSVPPASELARRARVAGLAVDASVDYAPLVPSLLKGQVARFRRVMETFAPDIVHVHGGRDAWLAALALEGASIAGAIVGLGPRSTPGRRPLVVRTKHNIFPIADHPFNRWLYGNFFDGIVCISTAIVEQCRRKPYIAAERLVLIPSACDVDRFVQGARARREKRREFGFRDEEVVVVLSGRFRPEKGHDLLLTAMPTILATVPNVRFLFLGTGSLKDAVAEQLRQQNLTGAVRLAGFRSDVAECLAAADIAVQPSRSEGLGTAVLEAGAAGLPVVATAIGGIPDIVVSGQTGLLVPPEDARALAEAIVRLATDAELRHRLGSAARQRVAEHFSPKKLGEKTDAYYRRLLSM